jgi:hypothetical protein
LFGLLRAEFLEDVFDGLTDRGIGEFFEDGAGACERVLCAHSVGMGR